MSRSLGLKAYRALTRRGAPEPVAQDVTRPDGELLWLHAAEPGNSNPLLDFAERMLSQRPGLQILITVAPGNPPVGTNISNPAIHAAELPSEHPQSVTRFVDAWRPDCGLWFWGALRPNLIVEATGRGMPIILVDADTDGFDGRRDRWLPDLARAVLPRFRHILTRSTAASRRLGALGLPVKRIEQLLPLTAGGQALPCNDTDFRDMSAALVGRSVWFAAMIGRDELKVVLSAHRHALRLSHRLLLIVLPADPADLAGWKADTLKSNFRAQIWPDDGEPDESTQVLLADDPGDRGLFFRLASTSFLGCSLISEGDACNPLEAAALGSAILYGPKVGRHLPTYTRLANAGAARIVNDADALGTAVNRLVAPDLAAKMAIAGWDVITSGAEATDRVIELVQDALDDAALAT